MHRKNSILMALAILFSAGLNAQPLISTRKLGKLDNKALKRLEEVNALVFKPTGYNTVMNPKLPDSLAGMMNFSNVERAELLKKRIRFNPYLAFSDAIELKKGDIFIGFSNSWIRLSSYYKYSSDSSSAEAFREKVNQNMTGKSLIGYHQEFELLEDVNAASRKLINADTVFIYDTKTKYRFRDTAANYGALLVHLVKFDLGYVSLRYYYPLDKRNAVLSEINDTWGIIQFKPDKDFTHPDHSGMIPSATEPDLYFGKFSFLNNPDQVRREEEQHAQKKLKRTANSLALQAVRLAQSKQPGEAKEKFAGVLAVDSNNIMAYRYLLLISMDENNQGDSRKYWNKLLEKDAKSTETWFLKGLLEKKYNELDSAAKTFEMITREKDTLHFRSFVELAALSVLKGEHDAADRYFNQAINIFKTEGEKSLRREGHRILNINDLFAVRLAYARFLNKNAVFEKSKMLLEQTLREDAAAAEATKKGEQQTIYGKLTGPNLAELNLMLALSYAGLKDDLNTRLYLEKARSLGKVLPEDLNRFLDN